MSAPAGADVVAVQPLASAGLAMRCGLTHDVREREGLMFHAFRSGSSGMAACSRWFLDELFVLAPDEVPYSRRCQRPACRSKWEAALKPPAGKGDGPAAASNLSGAARGPLEP